MNIKIPKNQILWLQYSDGNKLQYVVTSDSVRSKYFLYLVNDNNTLTKLKTASAPTFEEIGNY